MRGYRVVYIPGWDCHGLPIELKALKESSNNKSAKSIREQAKKVAEREMNYQRESFKSWAILGDWENPYLTMDPEYEYCQLEVFQKLFNQGLIYRGVKPVFWSPSSKTALAEAELEYNEEHVSKSIYVKFPIKNVPSDLQNLLQKDSKLFLLIWTTTPWTIPSNKSIAFNKSIEYVVCKFANESENSFFVVAKDRLDALEKVFSKKVQVVSGLTADHLESFEYSNPLFNDNKFYKVYDGDFVTLESGTGLVHCAPAHGADDFKLCVEKGIEVKSFVDDNGNFAGIGINDLEGLNVLSEGNLKVISMLQNAGGLFFQQDYVHSYPYDWRSKKPVIVRATKQWFVKINKIRNKAENILEGLNLSPIDKKKLASTILNRDDWCLSRQRYWGVPIPVFYQKNGEEFVNDEIIEHVKNLIRERGSDVWFNSSVDELLPAQHKHLSPELTKGEDTMDVWFDSGCSWNFLQHRLGMEVPFDNYCEGSDQHRGWFHSSLLSCVGSIGKAPYKQIITHGFVLDEKGRKMSKSIGNVVDPLHIIFGNNAKGLPNAQVDKTMTGGLGVDVMRLWASSSNYIKDISIGDTVLKNTVLSARKIRNTCRFMLANINDYFEKENNSHLFDLNNLRKEEYDSLYEIDKYLLHKLYSLSQQITNAYQSNSFVTVTQSVNDFVSYLSSFFFEGYKDRLYADEKDSKKRRNCQFSIFLCLEIISKSIAPILPHTSQDIFDHNSFYKNSPHHNYFQVGWFDNIPEYWNNNELARRWEVIEKMRDTSNSLLQTARENALIKSSLDAQLEISFSQSKAANNKIIQTLLKDETIPNVFNVSSVIFHNNLNEEDISSFSNKENQLCSVFTFEKFDQTDKDKEFGELVADLPPFLLQIRKSVLHKCPRCWCYNSLNSLELCPRCASVFEKNDFKI
eukprot:TRINITY_DN6749_c0_g1_i1.p1 TRINITY_DN6749_c0_g1~~TRINITY_DN6749_c0_g1_i1.p1  ORF type:complete len:1037 (+),score=308.71 TRINITY_DN6749_c0_g1_i1:382-3111(+)